MLRASTRTFAAISKRRRCILYVPGSSEKKLASSSKSNADCLVYDLEDSVTLSNKQHARTLVRKTLESRTNAQTVEQSVRINTIGSGLEIDDLKIILASRSLNSILIPKVESKSHIEFVCRMIDSLSPDPANVRILASIETARGLCNIEKIAAADGRIDALVFGAEDFAADVGLVRTRGRHEMLYARQKLVATACAHRIQSIDLVCVDYMDKEVLIEECEEGRRWGFSGKQAIHPEQVEIVQRTFVPSVEEVMRAKGIVDGWREHETRGVGAWEYDGKMVDAPMLKWARGVLSRQIP